MLRLRFLVSTCTLGFILAAPIAGQTAPAAPAPVPGLDTAGFDRSVKPGDKFYEYANGGWIARTEIPADRGSYGTSAILVEQTDRQVVDLIQHSTGRIGDYYASYLDSAAIEARGLEPLEPTLDSIAAIADRKALARFLGSTLRADVDGINATDLETPNVLGVWVAQDMDDPSRYSVFLLQGGLEMPERSYYVDSSAAMVEVRGKYGPHVAAMLELAGIADAKAKAAAAVALETELARAHVPREDAGNVTRNNNHWTRAEFSSKAPGLDWAAFFDAAGLGKVDRFVVWHPSAVRGLASLVGSASLDDWKAYLAFHAIQDRAPFLPKRVVDQSFSFYGPVLSGATVQRPRWKRAVDATDDALGYAVGKLYVETYFPPAEKKRAQEMVANIMAAFRERIDKLDWMAPATKKEAKAKLAVLKVGVGYPDVWPSYDGLEVRKGDAYGNAERASLFYYRQRLARLGKPVDRGEWVMVPQLVNAVNLPVMNAMNFPAAILQPPYFDPKRPLAMDYGAMGGIIGHEVSHSFDNQGALFDSKGRLRNWWTPADFKHFGESGAALAAQYDTYKPFPDLAVNGKLTLGENIADLAGLAASYDAWRKALGGKPAPEAYGLTGDQQFFLSYAQAWRRKAREQSVRNQILTDGHAPAMYRALTVRNLDPWYAAFDVQPGQALYLAPGDRVRVW